MILHVGAIEATDIPSMDMIGKSDPYLVFKSNKTNKKWKTKYVKNTNSPKWNENFEIPISEGKDDEITIELWDQDQFAHDDFISSLVILVKYLPFGKDTDEWYYFNAAKGVSRGGKVRLFLRIDKTKN